MLDLLHTDLKNNTISFYGKRAWCPYHFEENAEIMLLRKILTRVFFQYCEITIAIEKKQIIMRVPNLLAEKKLHEAKMCFLQQVGMA